MRMTLPSTWEPKNLRVRCRKHFLHSSLGPTSSPWRLVQKTEAVVFSFDPRETAGKSKPPLQLCDKPVKYSENPKILVIEFDPQCSFTRQAETSANSLRGRLQILQCLEGKSWGPRASDLRRLCVRPGGLYGIGTWGSFLTDTALSKLESCNSRVSCKINTSPVV